MKSSSNLSSKGLKAKLETHGLKNASISISTSNFFHSPTVTLISKDGTEASYFENIWIFLFAYCTSLPWRKPQQHWVRLTSDIHKLHGIMKLWSILRNLNDCSSFTNGFELWARPSAVLFFPLTEKNSTSSKERTTSSAFIGLVHLLLRILLRLNNFSYDGPNYDWHSFLPLYLQELRNRVLVAINLAKLEN